MVGYYNKKIVEFDKFVLDSIRISISKRVIDYAVDKHVTHHGFGTWLDGFSI